MIKFIDLCQKYATSNKKSLYLKAYIFNGVLIGIRTLDPLIKSQLLYQLSYQDKSIVLDNYSTFKKDLSTPFALER